MAEKDKSGPPSRVGALAALAFTVLLIAVGIWLAQGIISAARQQNCLASGRRDCLIVPER